MRQENLEYVGTQAFHLSLSSKRETDLIHRRNSGIHYLLLISETHYDQPNEPNKTLVGMQVLPMDIR